MLCSGGSTKHLETLCKAAIVSGANGIFIEVHPDPNSAPVDSNCQLDLSVLPSLLSTLDRLASKLENL